MSYSYGYRAGGGNPYSYREGGSGGYRGGCDSYAGGGLGGYGGGSCGYGGGAESYERMCADIGRDVREELDRDHWPLSRGLTARTAGESYKEKVFPNSRTFPQFPRDSTRTPFWADGLTLRTLLNSIDGNGDYFTPNHNPTDFDVEESLARMVGVNNFSADMRRIPPSGRYQTIYLSHRIEGLESQASSRLFDPDSLSYIHRPGSSDPAGRREYRFIEDPYQRLYDQHRGRSNR
jgi:hypothetical protein